MTLKPFKRAKNGLTKTDCRIIHERLTQLKSELERQIKYRLNPSLIPLTKTKYEGIERRFRILFTAIDILITHLNYLKNEKKSTSFRNSAESAKGSILQIVDRKNAPAGIRNKSDRKRNDRLPISRPQTEYRYNYVSKYGTSSGSSGGHS